MIERADRRGAEVSRESSGEVRGIVIAMGEVGGAGVSGRPRLEGFVYGEFLPKTPTLPFGRWKKAS